MKRKNRYKNLCNSDRLSDEKIRTLTLVEANLRAPENQLVKKARGRLSLKEWYFGDTDDGYERWSVNQLALDPPHISVPRKEPKPKPFKRVSVQNASKQELINALHKLLPRSK